MSSGCNRDYWNTSLTQIIEAIMDDNWSLEQRPKTVICSDNCYDVMGYHLLFIFCLTYVYLTEILCFKRSSPCRWRCRLYLQAVTDKILIKKNRKRTRPVLVAAKSTLSVNSFYMKTFQGDGAMEIVI